MSPAQDTHAKILVIGAGPVGLAMAAALKKRGISYGHVDAASGVGGNWLHGVYRTAHIVSSKKATEYDDYPMPDDYPDFPGADQMLRYLEAFARARGLYAALEFNKGVTLAEPLPDDSWRVTFVDGETRVYKGVAVCNGHHWDKRYPKLPGAFAGEIIHSKDYREPAQIAGKRVLTIGGGNSGVDMACEGGRFGASSDISLRTGYWYLPKMAFGRPLTDIPLWGLPIFMQRFLVKSIVKLTFGDYRNYGLQWPDHKMFDRHPAFGTDLMNAIKLGRVKARPGIKAVDGKHVTFVDGTSGEYDVILAATGFNNSFPFLPPGLVKVERDVVQVYSGAFPPGVRNLYIVGWAQARNGFGRLITPLADLYARMIEFQDTIDNPLGSVLEASFTQKLPKTHLVDPEAARREIWIAHKIFPPVFRLLDRKVTRRKLKAAAQAGGAETSKVADAKSGG